MTTRIDRDKLRIALEGLDEDTVFDILREALAAYLRAAPGSRR